jgi:transcriptional regulator NrdR family protein
MSNVVEFPLSDRPITESEIDKLHSEAFRDLENGICDCINMSGIAAQLMSNARIGEENANLRFAVLHLDETLRRLKESYYAARPCKWR